MRPDIHTPSVSQAQAGHLLEGTIVGLAIQHFESNRDLYGRPGGWNQHFNEDNVRQVITRIARRWGREAKEGMELDHERMRLAVMNELMQP